MRLSHVRVAIAEDGSRLSPVAVPLVILDPRLVALTLGALLPSAFSGSSSITLPHYVLCFAVTQQSQSPVCHQSARRFLPVSSASRSSPLGLILDAPRAGWDLPLIKPCAPCCCSARTTTIRTRTHSALVRRISTILNKIPFQTNNENFQFLRIVIQRFFLDSF